MTSSDTGKTTNLTPAQSQAADRAYAGAICFMLIAIFAVLDTALGVWMMGSGYTKSSVHAMGIPAYDFSTGGFIFGLGAVQYAIFTNGFGLTNLVQAICLEMVIGLTLALFFGYFSVRARQGMKWAFTMGLLLYALDTVLLAVGWNLDFGNFNPLAMHLILLCLIYRGLMACDEMGAAADVDATTGAPTTAAADPGPADTGATGAAGAS